MVVSLNRIKPLAFDWDEANKYKNWHKHKVHFKECEEVLLSSQAKIFPDPTHSQTEKRFVAYGITNKNRQLTIVFTIRNKHIRIISARNQNKKERQTYEKK